MLTQIFSHPTQLTLKYNPNMRHMLQILVGHIKYQSALNNTFLCLRPLAPEALCFQVVCLSLHPSQALNTLFPPVHGSVGPYHQQWPIFSFQEFPRESMEGMAWNFAWWCILTTFRTIQIMVTVCWFSSFWQHFYLVKQVKFGLSGHFLENAWGEWPKISHAELVWQISELIRLWLQIFFIFWRYFDLVKWVKFLVCGHFLENAWRE